MTRDEIMQRLQVAVGTYELGIIDDSFFAEELINIGEDIREALLIKRQEVE